MNESTLTQLKIFVERVVRPVRASIRRKRKMREELLAHVTSVFAEESTTLGDERLQLLGTGNADRLTASDAGNVGRRANRANVLVD